MSLSAKIILLVAVTVALLMGAVGYGIVERNYVIVRSLVDQVLQTHLEMGARTIRERIESIKRTAEVIASNRKISKALDLGLSIGINPTLNHLVAIYPHFDYVLITEPDGTVFAVNTRDSQGRKLQGEQMLGLDVHDNPLFVAPDPQAVSVGDPGVDPFLRILGQGDTMSQWFIVPVRKRDKPMGWVVVSYDWDVELTRSLADIRTHLVSIGSPTVAILLTEPDGNVVLGNPSPDPQGERGDAGPDRFVPHSDILWQSRALQFGERRLDLIVVYDRQRAFKPVTDARNLVLAVMGLGSAILVAVLYVMLRRGVLRRIVTLHQGTNAIRNGELEFRLPTLGDDELGRLAVSFNQMAEGLERITGEANEKAEQVRLLLDSTAEAIYGLDLDGNCTLCNPACLRMLGYDRADELLGRNMHDLIHHTHADGTAYPIEECRIYRAFREGAGTHADNEVLWRKDGTSFPVEYWSFPVRRDERIVGSVVTFLDITERKRAEEALRESEEWFRGIFELSSSGVALLTLDGNFVKVNQAFCDMLGYGQTELLDKNWRDVTYPEDIEATERLDDQILAGETPNSIIEKRYVRKDGTVLWANVTSGIIPDRQGQPQYIVGQFYDITAKKRAEDSLRAAELRNRLILESAGDGIYGLDLEGRASFVNPATCEMLGYEEDELLDQPMHALIHHSYPDGSPYPREKCPMYAAFTDGDVHEVGDEVLWRKDGTSFPIEYTSTPIRHGEDLIGAVVTFKDITERKRAEMALKDKNAYIRGIVENVVNGLVTVDEAGRIESFNPGAEKMFGYAAEEVIGRNVNVLMAEPHRTEHDGYIRNYLHTGESNIIGIGPRELTGRRKDGEPFPVEVAVSEMKVDDRRLFIGILVDITTRKRAEHALEESEARLRSIVDNSSSAIFLKGVDGKYQLVNRRFEEWYGVTGAEAVEATVHDVVPREHAELSSSMDREVIDTGQAVEREIAVPLPDGSMHTIISSKYPIRDSRGEVLAIGAVETDVTEQRQVEQQLQQAQKMEAVGNLTGGVAHDFNNILGIVLGNLQLLQRRAKDNEKIQKLAETAVDATLRGADLTKRLLAFSRRQELDPRVLEVNALVTGMDNLFRRTLGEQIEIETALAGDLWPVKTDPTQLESAILNLALNARDAMPGGGKLLIETSNEELDEAYVERHPFANVGPHVCVSMTDTGTGIPADQLDKIFEPFFTTKEVGKGSGLGLSMIFGFVKQTGGHINVYSEGGHGTRFRIYLPRSDSPCVPQDAFEVTMDMPTGTETVLLVEDEEQFRRTAALLLEELGYTVISEENGPDALAALKVYPGVELLLTDMIMPGGMNGRELAEKARELVPGLPVLLTSGYPRDAFTEGRRFELLSKPYTNDALARAIRRALDGGNGAEA